jgi:RND superfamily putative drug exporter
MHLLGPANWSLPAWLDRILPRLALESTEHGRGAAPGDGKEPATLSQGG